MKSVQTVYFLGRSNFSIHPADENTGHSLLCANMKYVSVFVLTYSTHAKIHSCRLRRGFWEAWRCLSTGRRQKQVRSGLRFCGHVKLESNCTYIVGLCLSFSNLILVQSEAGGDPAEPNVSQHVLVICHAAAAPSGT